MAPPVCLWKKSGIRSTIKKIDLAKLRLVGYLLGRFPKDVGEVCDTESAGRVNTMLACTLTAVFALLFLWTFADSFGVLLAFAIIYGGSGGGFVSLFPVVTADIVRVKNLGVKNIKEKRKVC